MNIYDRIAVKVLVSYLADFEKIERDKLIASMKADHDVFVVILKSAVKSYREEYGRISHSAPYQRYIQEEYRRYLAVIESPTYYDKIPSLLFTCLEHHFC